MKTLTEKLEMVTTKIKNTTLKQRIIAGSVAFLCLAVPIAVVQTNHIANKQDQARQAQVQKAKAKRLAEHLKADKKQAKKASEEAKTEKDKKATEAQALASKKAQQDKINLEASNAVKALEDGQTPNDIDDSKVVAVQALVDKVTDQGTKNALQHRINLVKEANKARAEAKTSEKAQAEQVANETGGTAVQASDGTWQVQTPQGEVVSPSQAQASVANTPQAQAQTAPQAQAVSQAQTPAPATPQAPAQTSEPYIVLGQIYDGLFDTEEEASEYYDTKQTERYLAGDFSMNGATIMFVYYSDDTTKWTVHWD